MVFVEGVELRLREDREYNDIYDDIVVRWSVGDEKFEEPLLNGIVAIRRMFPADVLREIYPDNEDLIREAVKKVRALDPEMLGQVLDTWDKDGQEKIREILQRIGCEID